MFKKVDLGHTCLVGAKDRKTLRSRIMKSLSLDAAVADSLLPEKSSLCVAKIAGTRHSLYMAGADPWLVMLQDGRLFPTIHALRDASSAIPALQIDRAVLAYIMRGAHLMIPGVANWSSSFQPGSLAVVEVLGCPYPVAVGIIEDPVDKQGLLRKTGRAMEILHYYGDGICKLSPAYLKSLDDMMVLKAESRKATSREPTQSQDGCTITESQGNDDIGHGSGNQADECSLDPNDSRVSASESIPPENQDSKDDTNEQDLLEDLEDVGIQPLEETQKINTNDTVSFGVPLVDMVLRVCFLQTLHGITDDKLPMDISAVYSQMTADGARIISTSAFKRLVKDANLWDDNICPKNATALISYKKSSFKKSGKMFQVWAKEGLISLKESRGTTSVVQINRGSESYCKFTPINIPKKPETEDNRSNKVIVRRFLAFSATQRKALASVGVQMDNKPMPVDQYKKIIIANISNDGKVIMEHMENAIQYHQISRGEESGPICKGPAQPVLISVEPRGNRKHLTTVKGLFNYLINADENAVIESLRRKFACSVSLNNGVILIQGRVTIKNELIEQFGLSQQHIKVV